MKKALSLQGQDLDETIIGLLCLPNFRFLTYFFFRPAADNSEVFLFAWVTSGLAAELVAELDAGFATELAAGRLTEAFTLILVSAPLPGFFSSTFCLLAAPVYTELFFRRSPSFNLNNFQPQVSQVLSSRVSFPVLGTE